MEKKLAPLYLFVSFYGRESIWQLILDASAFLADLPDTLQYYVKLCSDGVVSHNIL